MSSRTITGTKCSNDNDYFPPCKRVGTLAGMSVCLPDTSFRAGCHGDGTQCGGRALPRPFKYTFQTLLEERRSGQGTAKLTLTGSAHPGYPGKRWTSEELKETPPGGLTPAVFPPHDNIPPCGMDGHGQGRPSFYIVLPPEPSLHFWNGRISPHVFLQVSKELSIPWYFPFY